jgi:nickel transport protein
MMVVCFLLAALALSLCPSSAWAHKVTIFAWVEGDTVYTQSKFSGGKRAKNAPVVVYDGEGNRLLEGETDEGGEFSFKVPKKTTLRIVLKASMGHSAEWTIPEEEITKVADGSETRTTGAEAEVFPKESAAMTEGKTTMTPSAGHTVGLSRRELQEAIDTSLDKKLAPILTMLSEAVDPGPRMSDIMGGIGYILGLVGVAFYFSARKRRK